ncbi:MAG: (d)CMP kinase [Proteobacteria bacterium]|jgi:cytidylate kinase|nr:(d)CMP kinase [Pseudomonadota bacterium]MDA1301170.1 (d)CMP kinase [Pseudomonadota bacterium]
MNLDPIPVIAIDGPSGSGKGVITQRLATVLGFHILDSGVLYRLIGMAARTHGVPLDDEAGLASLGAHLDVQFRATDDAEDPLAIFLEGQEVTLEVRGDAAGVDASVVAALPRVRSAITLLQHAFRQPPGLVADGRDMGTVVFVDAPVKIYLTASAEARAERRYNQLKHKGIDVSLHALFTSIRERDERDMNREVAPLVPAADAVIIDSTNLGIDEVFERILVLVREKLN